MRAGAAKLAEPQAQLLHVGGRAHERQRDEVRIELDGQREVGDVLVGDGGELRPRVRDVDALARPERAGRDHARDDVAASTRSTASRGTPSPTTICERSVTRSAKRSRSTRSRPPSAPSLPQKTTVSSAASARARRLRRQPQLRALQVEQQAERAGRRARTRRAPPRRGGAGRRACRASSSAARSPCRRRRPVEHAGRVGRRTERGDDLRPPPPHAAQSGSCATRPAQAQHVPRPRRELGVQLAGLDAGAVARRGPHAIRGRRRCWRPRGSSSARTRCSATSGAPRPRSTRRERERLGWRG